MRYLFDKILFAIILSTSLILLFYGCSKENDDSPDSLDGYYIRATIDRNDLGTKTQHTFNGKSLKTTWTESDMIAILPGKIAFVQRGENSGNSAIFAPYTSSHPATGNIIALYPYSAVNYITTEKTYYLQLASQTGKLSDLYNNDYLMAKGTVNDDDNTELVFSPLCSVLRIPKGTSVSNNTNTGLIKITLTGDNVFDRISLTQDSMSFTLYSYPSIQTNVTKGILSEDIYICFFPKNNTGRYLYYLKTDKGDSYEFYRDTISTSKIYNVNTSSCGNVNFLDNNFKQYCVDKYDLNKDGEISYAEAKLADSICVNSKEIKSLVGLKHFTNISTLRCGSNQLTIIDVNGFTKLQILECNSNQIKTLDIGGCTSLKFLNCRNNQLTNLDLSGLPKLDTLYCHYNQLTSLNVSGCTALQYLQCNDNQLTSLNIKGCTRLSTLDCYNNKLASIDVSDCKKLEILRCYSNQISKDLDINEFDYLKGINCNSNLLTTLNVTNCTKLEWLHCDDNSTLSSLNTNGCISLKNLSFSNSTKNIKIVNVSRTALSKIKLTGTPLNSLLASECAELNDLDCSNNKLTTLDINNCIALTNIDCSNNKLTSLDVEKFIALVNLDCSNNDLVSLKLGDHPSLRKLCCTSNDLMELDHLDKYPELTQLYCDDNHLSSLDVYNNTKLFMLYFSKNNIASIDLSKNTLLKTLHCYENKLKELNVSKNTQLTGLRCHDNDISSIDISNNIALIELFCYFNKLTSLDVSKNTSLDRLAAWPQSETLSTLYVKKGQTIRYYKMTNQLNSCYPDREGTEIIEVE